VHNGGILPEPGGTPTELKSTDLKKVDMDELDPATEPAVMLEEHDVDDDWDEEGSSPVLSIAESYSSWHDPEEKMPDEGETVLVYGKTDGHWEYAEDKWQWFDWSNDDNPEKVWLGHHPVKAWTRRPEIHHAL